MLAERRCQNFEWGAFLLGLLSERLCQNFESCLLCYNWACMHSERLCLVSGPVRPTLGEQDALRASLLEFSGDRDYF